MSALSQQDVEDTTDMSELTTVIADVKQMSEQLKRHDEENAKRSIELRGQVDELRALIKVGQYDGSILLEATRDIKKTTAVLYDKRVTTAYFEIFLDSMRSLQEDIQKMLSNRTTVMDVRELSRSWEETKVELERERRALCDACLRLKDIPKDLKKVMRGRRRGESSDDDSDVQ